MVKVDNLCMAYGKKMVLKNISFQIQEGKIVGLLGANGAGKSTTMNILTGYLKPVSGRIFLDGVDMVKEQKKAKSKIGYLPEVPPLYKDMKVIEYLEFAARLKKVANVKDEVYRVMELIGVEERKYEYIKHLSKGWQQRVGLAYCVMGNPKVLILDEPLVGLDPSESKYIRSLLKELSKTHTIIISSHILKEIEELCDEILMLKDGELVLSDSLDKVVQNNRRNIYKIVVKGNSDKVLEAMEQAEFVSSVRLLGEKERDVFEYCVQSKNNRDIRDNILGVLVGKHFFVYGVEYYNDSLEDVFLDVNNGGGKRC